MIELHSKSEQTLKIIQIITLALSAGVVIFGVVAVVMLGALKEEPTSQLISLIALGFAGVGYLLHLVLPKILVQNFLQQNPDPDDNKFMEIFQSKTIIGLALLEGAAFFNLVACILEHHWWSLAVAAGLVLWMLAMFPNKQRVLQWIETQKMSSTP